MLDRTQRPVFFAPEPVLLSTPEEYTSACVGMPDASVDVCRVELVFPAINQTVPKGTAALVANLLQEGTQKFKAEEIADKFACWGTFVDIANTAEYMKVTMYSLSKFLQQSVDLLIHVLDDASFPEKSIEVKKEILKNRISIQKEKTSFEAGMLYKSLLFSGTHYSNTVLESDIDQVSRTHIFAFFKENIKEKCVAVFINGNYDSAIVEQLEGNFKPSASNFSRLSEQVMQSSTKLIKENDAQLQSSIRIGRLTGNRLSENYASMLLLNEIFGGYFGSRLMKNIREEKGYTYGISSNIAHFHNLSFFTIASDVKKAHRDDTFREIEKEIELLKSVLVSEEELSTVKNYIIGSFSGSINNSFDLLDKWKTIYLNHLPKTYYTDLQKKILNISSEEILKEAEIFFNDYHRFIKVSVG